MTAAPPRQSGYLTLTELLLLHGVLGGVGYAVAGKLGAACGLGLAVLIVGVAIGRAIRNEARAEDPRTMDGSTDPYDLQRFLDAQQGVYERALAEVRAGYKSSHWMWFIFPQYAGLGFSSTSRHYAIKSVAEAEAYLRHAVLGPRLFECAAVALEVEGRTATEIFGSPDDLKLRSCATLFAHVAPPGSVFEKLLDKYYRGEPDPETVRLVEPSE